LLNDPHGLKKATSRESCWS